MLHLSTILHCSSPSIFQTFSKSIDAKLRHYSDAEKSRPDVRHVEMRARSHESLINHELFNWYTKKNRKNDPKLTKIVPYIGLDLCYKYANFLRLRVQALMSVCALNFVNEFLRQLADSTEDSLHPG